MFLLTVTGLADNCSLNMTQQYKEVCTVLGIIAFCKVVCLDIIFAQLHEPCFLFIPVYYNNNNNNTNRFRVRVRLTFFSCKTKII